MGAMAIGGETGEGGGVWRWLPLVLFVAVAGVTAWVFGEWFTFDALRENRGTLLAWRDTHYGSVVLAYIVTYVAVAALSLPWSVFLTPTGGFLFGLVPGTLYTMFAATLGATCIFLAARGRFGAGLREKAASWTDRFREGFRENEVGVLLILRLVPAVPFFVANLLPAFFGTRTVTYVWTTLLGILPGTTVYTSLGTGLGEVLESGGEAGVSLVADPAIWGPLAGLTALVLVPVITKAVRGKPLEDTDA